MKVLVSTPYKLDSLSGNTVTANRIASILMEAGCEAEVVSANTETLEGDALIALHARKSANAVQRFRSRFSNRKILLYLTGTDLYEDVPSGCPISEQSMQLADVLVVSQKASLDSIPERFKDKAQVVRKSIALADVKPVQMPENSMVIASHLREVKQPFLVCEALALIPNLDVNVFLLGREIDDGYADMARQWIEEDNRFHWVEDCPHDETLGMMQAARATLNTSLLEGGANSVGESVMLDTPVLASKIEGNIGMLGDEYGGYFESKNAQALADLLEKVIRDESYYASLKSQVKRRQVEFSRKTEQGDWLRLLKAE